MKLTKIKATGWNGAGFGNSRAAWAIKGHEHWRVWSTGYNWVGHNTSNNVFIQGINRETLLYKIANTLIQKQAFNTDSIDYHFADKD